MRRRINRVPRLLSAQNRFQAGYQAVARGWLDLHVTDTAHSSAHSADGSQESQP